MTDAPSNDTRSTVDVLAESLKGADRVVVETRNALGEMDASYMHAPAVLSDLDTAQARIAELEGKLERLLGVAAGLNDIAVEALMHKRSPLWPNLRAYRATLADIKGEG